ncbi:type VI secretion system baseplate subunit TssK [Burkholderia sp. AU42008]|uniref:type VI secretion system baseplate subunit TssK n=1 Tax=unclassified Burkholderia TaxID=2613784 RepID=UPI000B79C384|nr:MULTISPECIES: type VI secretion system baseplate subunit TssK [unclassified Burkholderia]MBR8233192.1 type VI secretion system baseplate subunit TssK [Burkholderia sp. AU32357]MBY4876394.1 type VI secretion system baseplate subunit TssK [Burkholderia sp. AU42008]OXI40673.1 type VI secretion system-associated protein [Burkholderia sp. AU17457]
MKITRPLWAKGIFMTPQHFQQQAIWEQYAHDRVARIATPDAWGVVHTVLDVQALSVDRLQCTALSLRLPDGTLVDTETADWLPASRSLEDVPATVESVTVLLGLALMDAQGGNCIEPGEKPARPRRVTREYKQVADLNGDGQEEISVERNVVALLFDFEHAGDYVTCPIARLVRTPQGQFEPDATFVPPCLFLSASDRLMQRAQRLSGILSAKSASLAARRKARSDQIADFAVSDVALFWLLHSVNSAWPELARLVQAPDQHPERLYTVLARLAGALLAFSTTESLQSIPLYDHRAPEPMFAELESLIRTLLDAVIPSRVIPIALEQVRATTWLGRINDERLTEGAEYYLSVQAAMPAHALVDHLPRLCKVGAPDEVEQIVNSALRGIALRSMPRLPAAIPVRIENQYFALDSNDDAFKRMIDAHACQIYVPASIPEVSLELYAVLPS